jgi:FtsH-binding integral membrane protein
MKQHFKNNAERSSVIKKVYRLTTLALTLVLITMAVFTYLLFIKIKR